MLSGKNPWHSRGLAPRTSWSSPRASAEADGGRTRLWEPYFLPGLPAAWQPEVFFLWLRAQLAGEPPFLGALCSVTGTPPSVPWKTKNVPEERKVHGPRLGSGEQSSWPATVLSAQGVRRAAARGAPIFPGAVCEPTRSARKRARPSERRNLSLQVPLRLAGSVTARVCGTRALPRPGVESENYRKQRRHL